MNMRIRFLLSFLLLFLLCEVRLYAYVDPGSGALVWQALVAAFIGGVFYLKRFLWRLRSNSKKATPRSH
jgi:O-antigen/teichoic acid export membrane protein